MKIQHGSLALFAALALGAAAAQASMPIMECTAQHTASGEFFVGSGPKFVGKNEALNACYKWASKAGLDTQECKIVECHPVLDFNAAM